MFAASDQTVWDTPTLESANLVLHPDERMQSSCVDELFRPTEAWYVINLVVQELSYLQKLVLDKSPKSVATSQRPEKLLLLLGDSDITVPYEQP